MNFSSANPAREAQPTRTQAFAFLVKAMLFRLRRRWHDPAGRRPSVLVQRPLMSHGSILAESRTPLYTSEVGSEWALQAGKVHNLRAATRALHGRIVPAGEVFGFWANVGRATRRRGFTVGRELREGCIIPSVGGGLCQLSNALYDVALQAGLEIVERHAHSRRVPGAASAPGRDATVFWNYVDFRFRPAIEMQLSVELHRDVLVVRLLGRPNGRAVLRPDFTVHDLAETRAAESCETCGATSCFRHPEAQALPRDRCTVWVLDAFQPEQNAWMTAHRRPQDSLLLPLDSQRLGLGPYRWNSTGFASVRQAPWATLRRSLVSRRLAAEGAARQSASLAMSEAMARALTRRLPPLATHLVVSQNLLPYLWRDGVLGGRTFDVFMTRLPLREMEAVLDRATRSHPESRTLADFRAPSDLIAAESAALAAAERWVTPHAGIAELAGARACLLDWQLPPRRYVRRGEVIVFPGSTLGRKGAYELREAIQGLDRGLRLGGPVIERKDFWSGVELAAPDTDWLDGGAVVVLPAWVEHQPRRLLQAVAAGVPVIASEACGLGNVSNVITVPIGNVGALRAAIVDALEGVRAPHMA